MENNDLDKVGRAHGRRPRRSQEELLELGRRISTVLNSIGDRKSAAAIAGKSVDQLAAYAKGENEPPFRVLAKLADRADVRLDWLATGEEPMKRGGSATVVARPGGKAGGHKSMEDGLPMPAPHPGFDPASLELLDRSVFVPMLTRYLELLDRKLVNWTPEQRAKRFLLIYERCMRAGRVDESSISEAIDMLT